MFHFIVQIREKRFRKVRIIQIVQGMIPFVADTGLHLFHWPIIVTIKLIVSTKNVEDQYDST